MTLFGGLLFFYRIVALYSYHIQIQLIITFFWNVYNLLAFLNLQDLFSFPSSYLIRVLLVTRLPTVTERIYCALPVIAIALVSIITTKKIIITIITIILARARHSSCTWTAVLAPPLSPVSDAAHVNKDGVSGRVSILLHQFFHLFTLSTQAGGKFDLQVYL